jgi:hypothetical protein
VNGMCACNPATCPGCCVMTPQGLQCTTGTSDFACGSDAGACQFCAGATQCRDGGCR